MKNTKLQNSSLRKRKGFTLIELIVVIAILAILAAIAIPTFLGTLNRSKTRTHLANIRIIQSAMALYEAENGSAADAIADLEPTYIEDWPTSPGTYSFTEAGVFTANPGIAETETAVAANGTVF